MKKTAVQRRGRSRSARWRPGRVRQQRARPVAAAEISRRFARSRARRSTSPATGCRSSAKTGAGGWRRRRRATIRACRSTRRRAKSPTRGISRKTRRRGCSASRTAPATSCRQPGRLHITWQDENTLKIEFDAGTQTRLLHFDAGEAAGAGSENVAGVSTAAWERPGRNAVADARVAESARARCRAAAARAFAARRRAARRCSRAAR